ncbi:MAG TPA: Asp-tRNA(Asn)/Glu-tRNA(Gln) amidotransferase subunit GatC [Gemmatimonadaceae bacterium]
MAVTHDDVRHVAELARVGIDETKLDELVRELNGILVHMEVLSKVDVSSVEPTAGSPAATGGTPLRSDSSGPIPLLAPLESFAPSVRDGFIIVPRLATHDDAVDRAP